MIEKARLQREKRIKEARVELIEKYGEPFISGTKKVAKEVEEEAQIETVSTYLNRRIREKRGTTGVATGITEEGIVTASLKCGGQTIDSDRVLPIGVEFWVVSPEPRNES